MVGAPGEGFKVAMQVLDKGRLHIGALCVGVAERLIAAHNAMEARIAAMLDEKDVMLGAIGHDLKTPLAALRVRPTSRHRVELA